MKAYILSILGIVITGIIIDIIIPSGTINKYIKSIYSIFVVVVILSPLINFFKNINVSVGYNEFEVQENLINYIFENRVNAIEKNIETDLKNAGYEQITVELKYSTNNNEITYNSCMLNLENMLITSDKPHINKYEFIKEIVCNHTDLDGQEIIINE